MLIRKFQAFWLIGIIALSNVSVPTFKHVCHSAQKSWASVFIPSKKGCCKSKQAKICTPCPDLQKSNTKNEVRKSPCCESYNDIVHLGAQYGINSANKSNCNPIVLFNPVGCVDALYKTSYASTAVPCLSTSPPYKKLYGRSLLIFEQLFLC